MSFDGSKFENLVNTPIILPKIRLV